MKCACAACFPLNWIMANWTTFWYFTCWMFVHTLKMSLSWWYTVIRFSLSLSLPSSPSYSLIDCWLLCVDNDDNWNGSSPFLSLLLSLTPAHLVQFDCHSDNINRHSQRRCVTFGSIWIHYGRCHSTISIVVLIVAMWLECGLIEYIAHESAELFNKFNQTHIHSHTRTHTRPLGTAKNNLVLHFQYIPMTQYSIIVRLLLPHGSTVTHESESDAFADAMVTIPPLH